MPEIPLAQFNQRGGIFGGSSQEIKDVLDANLYSENQTVEGTILKDAEVKARAELDNLRKKENKLKSQELTLSAIVSELKGRKNEDSSLYDYLVVDLMRQLDPFNMARFYRGPVCLEEKSDFFPRGFPFQLRQEAESILTAKLKDIIGSREILDYLVLRERGKAVKQLERDFAFANQQEVDSHKYAGLMFELRRLLIALPNNEFLLKRHVITALKEHEEINLVHIKCFRFVYPFGKELRVLPDLKDCVIPTKEKGRYFKPRGETDFPARALRLVGLFRNYGLKANLTILVAAEDLEILYPDDSLLIDRENKEKVASEAEQYLSCLKAKFNNAGEVVTLKAFLKKQGLYSRYREIRRQCLNDIRRGRGRFLKNETFERKVNSQFERYFRIFGPKHSRNEARRSAAEQAASMLALSVLGTAFNNLIMFEEDKGPENKLIAGAGLPSKIPVIFLELRSPSEFIENVC